MNIMKQGLVLSVAAIAVYFAVTLVTTVTAAPFSGCGYGYSDNGAYGYGYGTCSFVPSNGGGSSSSSSSSSVTTTAGSTSSSTTAATTAGSTASVTTTGTVKNPVKVDTNSNDGLGGVVAPTMLPKTGVAN